MQNPQIMLLFYGAIFVVIYFFFLRPQSQKAKKEKEFIDSLQKGDKVILTNGMHGIIDRVEDGTFMVEIDKNVKVRMEKSGISGDLTQAINGKDKDKDAKAA